MVSLALVGGTKLCGVILCTKLFSKWPETQNLPERVKE